jgi:hypothetical protein
MQKRMVQRLVKVAALAVALTGLQACSPAYSPSSNTVAQAYESSGVVAVSPYNRSIFQSTNF